MRLILILFIFFLNTHSVFSENFYWEFLDKKLMNSIARLDRNNPKEIERFFKKRQNPKLDFGRDTLGFGWTMKELSRGGGNISITATFFYFQDSLVAYVLDPRKEFSEEKILKYKSLSQIKR